MLKFTKTKKIDFITISWETRTCERCQEKVKESDICDACQCCSTCCAC